MNKIIAFTKKEIEMMQMEAEENGHGRFKTVLIRVTPGAVSDDICIRRCDKCVSITEDESI